MSRVKRSVHAKKKRRKVLKEAKGYYGRKHSSYRFAIEQVQRSGMYAYRDRRNRKRDFRRLWITRINAALDEVDLALDQRLDRGVLGLEDPEDRAIDVGRAAPVVGVGLELVGRPAGGALDEAERP